ncbi:MAG: tRNA (5-methylaminomethyl-2-thiouridine)(34)-methyltransferase MnmD [Proteobacteria bacterium]|nr:tRNA (5-methylaminomethyl-2-thiouridine)(34)-methyltransferase MnmD [Pseudomonadota bacterium]
MTSPEKIGAPSSREFDDVYFSEEDGLAESAHVFLSGNNLPEEWQDKARFVICEAGFGTGLNVLSAWKLFEETAPPGHYLDIISIEKFPLSRADIASHLTPWKDTLGSYLDDLLNQYPPQIPGFHRLRLSDSVTLTLIFDDINDALPQIQANVDAWFLDGFMPSLNPDMWSASLFGQMARLSHPGSRVATYTAAGNVRRALTDAGFKVERVTGYGSKRHMTVGCFEGRPS